MLKPRNVLALLIALALLWTPEWVHAQAEPGEPANQLTDAQLRFQEASEAFAAEDFERAAALFQQAHELSPHASVQFNAGISWDKAEKPERAATAYERALDMGGLTSEQAEQASARLAALKTRLGYVMIDAPVGAVVSVAHVDQATVPTRFYLTPGAYQLRIQHNGTRQEQSLEVGAGQIKTVELSLGANQSQAQDPTPPPEAPSPEMPTADTQKVWGIVSIAAGAVAAGVAIYLGVNALSARDEYNDSGHTDADARQRASDLRLGTNIAWGGAGALGITGTVLLLTSPSIEF